MRGRERTFGRCPFVVPARREARDDAAATHLAPAPRAESSAACRGHGPAPVHHPAPGARDDAAAPVGPTGRRASSLLAGSAATAPGRGLLSRGRGVRPALRLGVPAATEGVAAMDPEQPLSLGAVLALSPEARTAYVANLSPAERAI